MLAKCSFSRKAAVSLALLIAGYAHAIPKGPCDPKPEEVCCEKPKPGPFAFSYPKDLNLSCPNDFCVHLDFLVMQPQEEGLEYAVEDTNGAGFTIAGGNVQGFSSDNRNWSWDFGFRLGMGFYLNHDAWNVNFDWFWFNINQESQAATIGSALLIPLWFNDNPSAGNAHASARWSLKMNVFDITLGKPHHISRYVIFSPFFGLRGAWIDQDYTARYGGIFDAVNGVKMKASNDFSGGGLRAGLNTEWNVAYGWNLLANVSASMLYGKFNVSQDTQHATLGVQLENDFYQVQPNLEMQFGVSWGCYFNKQRNRFSLQATYEFQQWWEQLWLRKILDGSLTYAQDTVGRGDLSVNGLDVRFLFDF